MAILHEMYLLFMTIVINNINQMHVVIRLFIKQNRAFNEFQVLPLNLLVFLVCDIYLLTGVMNDPHYSGGFRRARLK